MKILDFKLQKIIHKYGTDPSFDLRGISALNMDIGNHIVIATYSSGAKKASVWFDNNGGKKDFSVYRCYYGGEMMPLEKIPDLHELLEAIDHLDEDAIISMFKEKNMVHGSAAERKL